MSAWREGLLSSVNCSHADRLHPFAGYVSWLCQNLLAALDGCPRNLCGDDRSLGEWSWKDGCDIWLSASDRRELLGPKGRRRLILAGSGFLISCWLASAGACFFGFSVLVYLGYILWGLSLLSLPVIDAMMADHIETPDRSRVYSTMLVANFIPGSVTGFIVASMGSP